MKDKLLHALEERTGLNMKRNHDFAYLSELLLAECHEYISTTTLKRMWGYIHDQESKPSKNTLNVIANFLGFDDFADFCNRGGGYFCKRETYDCIAERNVFQQSVLV